MHIGVSKNYRNALVENSVCLWIQPQWNPKIKVTGSIDKQSDDSAK